MTPRFLLGALGWGLGIEDGLTMWIGGTVGPPRFTGSYTSELGREMYLGFLCVRVVEIMSLLARGPGASAGAGSTEEYPHMVGRFLKPQKDPQVAWKTLS